VREQRSPEMPQGKPSAAPEGHYGAGQQREPGEEEGTAGQERDRNGDDRSGGHQYRNFRPEKALEEQQESGECEKQGSPTEHLRPAGVESPGRGQQRAARKPGAADERGGQYRGAAGAETTQEGMDSSRRLAAGAGAEPDCDDPRRNQHRYRGYDRHERRVAQDRQEGRIREESRKRGAGARRQGSEQRGESESQRPDRRQHSEVSGTPEIGESSQDAEQERQRRVESGFRLPLRTARCRRRDGGARGAEQLAVVRPEGEVVALRIPGAVHETIAAALEELGQRLQVRGAIEKLGFQPSSGRELQRRQRRGARGGRGRFPDRHFHGDHPEQVPGALGGGQVAAPAPFAVHEERKRRVGAALFPDPVGKHPGEGLFEVRVASRPRHRTQLPVVESCATLADRGSGKRPFRKGAESAGLGAAGIGPFERGGHGRRPRHQVGGIPHLTGKIGEKGVHSIRRPGGRLRPCRDRPVERNAAGERQQGRTGQDGHDPPAAGSQQFPPYQGQQEEQGRGRRQRGVDGARQGGEPVRGVGESGRKEREGAPDHQDRRQTISLHALDGRVPVAHERRSRRSRGFHHRLLG